MRVLPTATCHGQGVMLKVHWHSLVNSVVYGSMAMVLVVMIDVLVVVVSGCKDIRISKKR